MAATGEPSRCAVNAYENGAPTNASGTRGPSLTTRDVMVIVQTFSTRSVPLVTRSVKVYVPGVVATPIRPALAPAGNQVGISVRIDRPGGSDPELRVQV